MTTSLHGSASQANMALYGGGYLSLAAPDPATVNIQDIAHHLSQLCRFNGATREFYSIAQHSVYVSDSLPRDNRRLRLLGLLHDAHEAYAGDVIRPLKGMLGTKYVEICLKLDEAIYAALKIEPPTCAEKKLIKQADDAVCRCEAECLMNGGGRTWDWHGIPHREMPIRPLPPESAESLFLERWYELL